MGCKKKQTNACLHWEGKKEQKIAADKMELQYKQNNLKLFKTFLLYQQRRDYRTKKKKKKEEETGGKPQLI